MVQKLEKIYKKCKDCLANYPEGFYHVCPPWLKEAVKRYNENKKKNAKPY